MQLKFNIKFLILLYTLLFNIVTYSLQLFNCYNCCNYFFLNCCNKQEEINNQKNKQEEEKEENKQEDKKEINHNTGNINEQKLKKKYENYENIDEIIKDITNEVQNNTTEQNTKQTKSKENSECPICLCSIDENEVNLYFNICKHFIHKECLKALIKQCIDENKQFIKDLKCPICRNILLEADKNALHDQ